MRDPGSDAALLLLADGRLPVGGYAHSGGLEAVVQTQHLTVVEDVDRFLEGRVATVGRVAACFAAAACAAARADDPARLQELDAELDARMPAPTARAVSRSLGRQLRRGVSHIHDHALLQRLGPAPHQPLAYGVVAAAFGLTPHAAARIVLHEAVAGPAAAVKVLQVDLFAVHAALVRLLPLLDGLADEAEGPADAAPAELPADGAPLLDIAAEYHRRLQVRLFAS